MLGNKIHILEENEDWTPLASGSLYINGVKDEAGAVINGHVNSRDTGLVIDKAAYTVYLEGTKIAFPKKEFELLLLLASNPRKVFKRVEILQQIWGREFKQKDSRSLDVHIRMLRKKLQDHFITTIRGVGYKLEK